MEQGLTSQTLTLEAAKVLALKVLKQVMEEKLDEKNVQIAQVVPRQGYSILTQAELSELIKQIEPASTTEESTSGATVPAAAAPSVP